MAAGRMMVAGAIGLLAGAGAMLAAGAGTPAPTAAPPPDRAAIERIVHDYILAHPEILPEAMARLQEREAARTVDTNRSALETPFAGAWAGAADGDVTLVEFTDYACGYCRRSVADIDRLLGEDHRLKVVYRELPILSAESEAAAKVALSAARQGRHAAFHKALFAAGPLGAATIAAASRTAGLDPARVKADEADPAVAREVEANLALARTVGLTGTPTFVVGGKVLQGAVGYDSLKAAVAAARGR